MSLQNEPPIEIKQQTPKGRKKFEKVTKLPKITQSPETYSQRTDLQEKPRNKQCFKLKFLRRN